MKKIIFVTGTDTNAGKTVLTALLLAFLRRGGCDALAMKPFCSGSRHDALLLHSLEKESLTLDEINPFYFDKPLTPAAAGGRPGVSLQAALKKIRALAARCDVLIVEAVGGLLAPLAKNYSVRDIIRRLNCQIIVVCPNRLGAINHTLLTVEALQGVGVEDITIVMMGVKNPDLSAASNPKMIRQRLPAIPLFCLPHLGKRASTAGAAKRNVKYLQIMLARLLGHDNLHVFFRKKEAVEQRNLLTTRFRCSSVSEE